MIEAIYLELAELTRCFRVRVRRPLWWPLELPPRPLFLGRCRPQRHRLQALPAPHHSQPRHGERLSRPTTPCGINRTWTGVGTQECRKLCVKMADYQSYVLNSSSKSFCGILNLPADQAADRSASTFLPLTLAAANKHIHDQHFTRLLQQNFHS